MLWISNFCLKWSKWAQKGPKRPKQLDLLEPSWPFCTTLEHWQACHVWPFLAYPSLPQSKKRFITNFILCFASQKGSDVISSALIVANSSQQLLSYPLILFRPFRSQRKCADSWGPPSNLAKIRRVQVNVMMSPDMCSITWKYERTREEWQLANVI